MGRKYLPVVKIDKKDQVGYRILNGLAKKREYVIDNLDNHKRGLLKNIGRSVKPLEPSFPVIWHSPDRITDKRLIKLPENIKIDEKTGEKTIFFTFKRRNIF